MKKNDLQLVFTLVLALVSLVSTSDDKLSYVHWAISELSTYYSGIKLNFSLAHFVKLFVISFLQAYLYPNKLCLHWQEPFKENCFQIHS